VARVDYWNHNVQYQPVILRAVPPGCGAALEVGCGDGLLASRLGPDVGGRSGYLAYPLADAGFDFACANTSLHHMDFAAALARAVHGKGDPGAPIKDPEMTWAEVRAAARRTLPGVRYRRHLLWRYSLLWSKPRG
jgi:hypothetical protein